MKRFSYDGEIWHHLSHRLKPHQIISRKGDWVLSTIKDYKQAADKESVNLRAKSASFLKDNAGMGYDVNAIRGKFGHYSLDHIEVFIEKIK